MASNLRSRAGRLAAVFAVLVTGAPSAPAAGAIAVSCEATGATAQLPADFVPSFCTALVTALRQQLRANFVSRPAADWTTGERAVAIRLSVRSPHLAEVTIETGRVDAAEFRAERSSAVTLSAMDRPLSAFSAATLVRSVAQQLDIPLR